MRWLLFLSKLAFICNLAFLLSFLLRITNWLSNRDIHAYIIIIGWVLSVLFNPFTVLCYLLFFLLKRKYILAVPGWLIVVNVFFLFLQLVFLLLMNVE
jgi:hypothetical protein